jgi:hypothetical protein
MIYINPIGGLGNMFFHIAAIYSLAKDNNDELSLLNISSKIQNLIADTRCKLTHAAEYQYLFDRFKQYNGHVGKRHHHPFRYSPIPYNNGCEYFGYYQCEEYFKHRRNEILNLFGPSQDVELRAEKYEHLFNNISLHVRRGDYLKAAMIHTVQDISYYNKALAILPSNMKVIVFSDDLEWCQQNFIGDRFVFIDEIDYVSIYLMSKMNHHIIGNSSFSWWGAWLSTHENKVVIAPKNWFGEGFEDATDIIPKNWIKL